MIRPGARVALLCVWILGGCGGDSDSSTESAIPPTTMASAQASATASGDTPPAVRAAFLGLMSTPNLSFHADYDADFEYLVVDGEMHSSLKQSVDVSGSDAHLLEDLTVTMGAVRTQVSTEIVLVDGAAYLKSITDGSWVDVTAELDDEAAPVPLNPFGGLDERRLTFMGMTAEGLYEFDINSWILGEILDPYDPEWESKVGTLLAIGDFTNRVFVDETGTPHRLTSTFAFTSYADGVPGEAELSVAFSRIGEPITIEKPALAQAA